MNCKHCNAEFVRSNNPRHIYCGKLCKTRADRLATKLLRRMKGPDLQHVPQRMHIQGIDLPLIPEEYRFLYGVRPDELVSARAPLSGSFEVVGELA